ncbi:non-canonical purine NTP diphosphatase [Aquimarina sp. ERC-38]|uniref:non-canonical purine NTP diphosphatase n=1 Tax=Aquimarina sp. ERC-38 TaxID=2949996 RepID=UPI0022462050|nr:non-canonical purine NTP diphosphatase [Aquimarina sp. ERC-38]UZO79726.1 non-canonical purine NTP diphosphatase [Aquimarina sp. ERC-38]
MNRLVFATHNDNKVKEVKAILPPEIDLVSLTDIECHEDIPETASTLEGNALLKATFVKEKYNLDCFADDTGLEIEALDNEPGVYSARYAGPERNAHLNMDLVLHKLQSHPNRKARFVTSIVLLHQGKQYTFTGICNGKITQKKSGTQGFGYDPIFQPEGYDKTFAELSIEEKNKISHRGKAFTQLIEFIKNTIS